MPFKHFIRDAWLTASYYAGLSQLYNALKGQKRGIITYHNVLPVAQLPKHDTYNVDVTAAVFEKQMVFLKNNFNIRPIDELSDASSNGFFLTVDDGMLNNHEILSPILEKYDLTALFAVCPAMIDQTLPHIWRDHFFLLFKQFEGTDIFLPFNGYATAFRYSSANEAHAAMRKHVYTHKIADVYGLLKEVCAKNNIVYKKIDDTPLRYGFMDWQQVSALQQKGHTIASHTMTHRILKFLSEDEKRYELAESKRRLEEKLTTKIDWLVYPYGGPEQIDNETVRIANEAGYTLALMNVRKPVLGPTYLAQPRFALPPTANVPHLHAIVSGYKNLLK